ncbi:DNA-binding transcriptional repressor FabR [Actinomadura rubteroloni]|uniref:DNA-binding transcriptional repressor FabR n=1 Tax=Actinomadura rubteroloni TaxID=1926885 RepID=A0A2P4UC52_9ACTN|nr:TetR/AcrR family transcriptional regulator [Actinomadura rubteroloni]POM22617.1 DNA-binding transcriptional repressor FabR [Actinomadura rubteroloni]
MSDHGLSDHRLTREDIIDAALDIVTREGSTALSMRRVATAVGSAPMSIYRHVRGKDELLTLLMDRVFGGLPRPVLPQAPRDRLLALLLWQHGQLAGRPWITEVLSRSDVAAPALLWLMEDLYAAWTACGLTLPEAARAHRVTWVFSFGDLVQRIHPAYTGKRLLVTGDVDPSAHPTLDALGDAWNPHGRHEHFAGDLTALVDALLTRGTARG